jgi:bifunctional DNA-binding transcriptional regulator/antitoxin component of YhaV-PrlF toxin-antitoxin module
VPKEVRRKLGVGPGSVLEWHKRGDEGVVRCAGCFSLVDIHAALFPVMPLSPCKSAGDLKRGIRKYIRKRHMRR